MPSRLALLTSPTGDVRRLSWSTPVVAPTIASLAYLAYAIWLTWPMPTHLTDAVWGPGGDVVGNLTGYRELAQHAFPFLPGRIESFAAPEGLDVNYPFHVATWPSSLLMYLGSLVFGAVVTMNLLVLSGFVLTGTATMLLVRRQTGDAWAGGVAGWAAAFSLSNVFNAVSAPDFVHLWVIVLLVWRAIVVQEAPTRRNGLLLGAAAVVAVSWNPYFLLMGTVAFAALAAATLLVASFDGTFGAHVRSLAWAVLVLVAAAVVYGTVTATAEHTGVRERALGEVYLYSARPEEFLDPPPSSRILGWLDLPASRTGVTTTFYLGLTVLTLALVACVAAARRGARPRLRADVVSLVLLAAAALVWSMPPTLAVGGVTIRFPASFVGEVTTTWRIYGRFGLIVGLAVCLLAGIGLARLRATPRAGLRAAVLVAAAVLVFLDVRGARYAITSFSPEPPIYATLRTQPAGAVAEYPLIPSTAGPYDQLYRQEFHHRRLLNGYDPGTAAERRALTLTRLDDRTARRLAKLGIRYVLLQRNREVPVGLAPPGTPTRAYREIARDDQYTLYRVAGAPAAPAAD